MKELCDFQKCLIAQVQAQMSDLRCVNTHELGEVIDMIKDLSEACYYSSIVEAMEKEVEVEDYDGTNYYGIGAMEESNKKMGHSPMKRKSYMESKERHLDQALLMKELEDYAQELTSDLMEMVKDATPEEKIMLQQKIATLATKIV